MPFRRAQWENDSDIRLNRGETVTLELVFEKELQE